MNVPSEKLSIGRHYSTFYPLRIVELAAQLLSIETRDLVCTVIRATERNKLHSEAEANASREEDTAEMQERMGVNLDCQNNSAQSAIQVAGSFQSSLTLSRFQKK